MYALTLLDFHRRSIARKQLIEVWTRGKIDENNLYFLIIKVEGNAKLNNNSRSTTTTGTTTPLNEKITLRVAVF